MRVATLGRQFVLLAPPQEPLRTPFQHVEWREDWHDTLLADMQRLRGRIYLEEGAIELPELSEGGRHELEEDQASWHLLLMSDSEEVLGCMRYRHHEADELPSGMTVYRSALAQCEHWGPTLKKALEDELAEARREGVGFGEAGGWALAEAVRFSTEAVRMVLATYSLAQLLGHALVISTATLRNASAGILRRIGGRSLRSDDTELPTYYDPQHKCEMQVLRFDSRKPNPRYRTQMEHIRAHLLNVPVIKKLRR